MHILSKLDLRNQNASHAFFDFQIFIPNDCICSLRQYRSGHDLQALIRETQTPVIELPKLPVRVASTVLQQRLTYADSLRHRGKGFGVVEQAAVKSYLRSAYAAFESTGYLPSM